MRDPSKIPYSSPHAHCANVKLDLHFCIVTDEQLISDLARLSEDLYKQIRDIWAGERTGIEIKF